ncbi:unnamed protein product [Symbiodinium sp. CCMP2592]|nr:unnamed protein product [Symbiodinium sp. CCMP2592]
MAALTWSFSAKTPPSPVPEGDEEVSPLHGERLKYLYQAEPCNLEALSGESTDCNCSKTSASSSQGAANLFVVVPRLMLPVPKTHGQQKEYGNLLCLHLLSQLLPLPLIFSCLLAGA